MTRRGAALFLAGLGVTALVAVGISQFAAESPDGLEYVAEQEGFAGTAADHALGDSPLADYGENLDGGDGAHQAVAGIVGNLVTLAHGFGLFWLVRRRDRAHHPASTG